MREIKLTSFLPEVKIWLEILVTLNLVVLASIVLIVFVVAIIDRKIVNFRLARILFYFVVVVALWTYVAHSILPEIDPLKNHEQHFLGLLASSVILGNCYYLVGILFRRFIGGARAEGWDFWSRWKFFVNFLNGWEKVEHQNPLEVTVTFKYKLHLPKALEDIVVTSYGLWLLRNPSAANHESASRHGTAINRLMELVPAKDLIAKGEASLYDFILPTLARAEDDDTAHSYFISLYELGPYAEEFKQITVKHVLPEKIRDEHMHIVAGSGQGKTQLIQNMILDDLDRDCSIVVIDSQGDLVNKLASIIPEDRMILVDPDSSPPALNIFANTANTQREIATAIDLYEYIFSALNAAMTARQATLYRFVSRLLMVIPGATIHTMLEVLGPKGLSDQQDNLLKLGATPRAFFENEYDNVKQYGDTRREVALRLYALLESEVLSQMLGASANKINMREALDDGKVILVNTNKNYLKQTGSSLLGRIFISLVMQAVMSREEGSRKRVYLYIDEAQDYAEDSHVLFNMFEQGRKYGLGIIWAHQYLGQLPEQLSKSISANTSIKLAGGVSSQDARTLAGQMRTNHELIDAQPKGTFLASIRGGGVIPWKVDIGRLEGLPRASPEELQAIYGRMRHRYGPSPRTSPLPPAAEAPSPAAEAPSDAPVPDRW